MSDEELAKVREHLGMPELAADAALATLLTATESALDERDSLTTQLSRITGERDNAIALSKGDVKEPDPISLSYFSRALKTERETSIAAGAISQAEADELDALLCDNGKPNKIALSMAAGSTDPFAFRLYEIRRRYAGSAVKTGKEVARPISASRNATDANKPDNEAAAQQGFDQGKAYRDEQLKSRGLSVA